MSSQKNSMKQDNDIENKFDFLQETPKKNPYTVPKDYFEVLPEVISTKILDNNNIKFSFDKLSCRILVPLSAFLLVFSFFYLNGTGKENTALTAEEISDYLIEEHYDEFEEEMLVESYAELLAEAPTSADENEVYIDYLIENEIELETLIESY